MVRSRSQTLVQAACSEANCTLAWVLAVVLVDCMEQKEGTEKCPALACLAEEVHLHTEAVAATEVAADIEEMRKLLHRDSDSPGWNAQVVHREHQMTVAVPVLGRVLVVAVAEQVLGTAEVAADELELTAGRRGSVAGHISKTHL